MDKYFDGFKNSSDDYGKFLGSIIEYNRCKTVVEIGVAYGTTTKYLCEALKNNNKYNDNPGDRKLFGFDNWKGGPPLYYVHGSKGFANNYLKENDIKNYELIEIDTTSEEFRLKIKEISESRGGIDFVFIDGDHSYKGVKNDFEKIYPFLSKYGIIAFHDTFNISGSRRFAFELRTKYYDGTYDVINIPWGNGYMLCGMTLLFKREQFLGKSNYKGPLNTDNDKLENLIEIEKEWLKKEIKNNEKNNIS